MYSRRAERVVSLKPLDMFRITHEACDGSKSVALKMWLVLERQAVWTVEAKILWSDGTIYFNNNNDNGKVILIAGRCDIFRDSSKSDFYRYYFYRESLFSFY